MRLYPFYCLWLNTMMLLNDNSMAKKTPKYMQKPASPKGKVSKAGNPQMQLKHFVALLDHENKVQISGGDLVRTEVQETYVWNQDHRRTTKSDKGHWEIPEKIELAMFVDSRYKGCFTAWKAGNHKGWGVLPAGEGQLIKIGKGCNGNDVKVCKFVEGNHALWHGYPIDYREEEDVICDNALSYWYNVLHVIRKSEIEEIKDQQDSSLV